MAKPNLFIVGAPKCGTTAWVRYLSSHPDVFFSAIKEPHYFCDDLAWRTITTEEEYRRLFDLSESAKIVGEASSRYLLSNVAAKSIWRFNPEAKIIILVRDQEDCLPSLHNQGVFMTQECIEDFEVAWRLSSKRNGRNVSRFCKERKFLDYKACGKFSEQVERYFDAFPEDQIRVFHFRDWSRNPRQIYVEILRFLDLEDDGRTDFPPVNEAKHRRVKWLAEFLINPPPHLRGLARALQRLSGGGAGRLADSILKSNQRRGYRNNVSEALRSEIRGYYARDNEQLEPRLWRPAESARKSSEQETRPPNRSAGTVHRREFYSLPSDKIGETSYQRYVERFGHKF